MSIYSDLLAAYQIIGDIAEVLLREAKAKGLGKGTALDARLLHEYLTVYLELERAIQIPRKNRKGRSVANLSSLCLDHAGQIRDAVRRDRPAALECTFLRPGEATAPVDSDLLIDAVALGVSTESILYEKTGRSQPVISRAVRKLERGSFLERIDATHCARAGSREKLIIADGEGIKWCQANGIPVKIYRYNYREGGHYHHLIANYFAYTTKGFKVVFTYYGFRSKHFPISSHYKDEDGGRIEPDLRGFWTDLYSEQVYLPVEIEVTYKPEPFMVKVKKYVCSKEARVIVVTNDDDLTEKYRRLLERTTPVRSKYAVSTSFELYAIVPLSLKKKEEWSTLKPAGSVVVG